MAPSLKNSNGGGGGGASSRFISEELLEDILVRLPVKSIVRFKSVCKTWLSLFNSRLFIDLHRSRIRCDNSLAVHSSTKQYLLNMAPELRDSGWDLRLSSPNYKNWGRVMSAFGPLNNGIYGLTSHVLDKSTSRFPILPGKIGFCNPATHDYKLTNPFPSHFHSLLSEVDLKPCQINFGFGSVWKNSKLDYRVVVLINYGEPFISFLSFVYSLQSGEWKKLVDYERGKRDFGNIKAVTVRVPLVLCPQMSAFEGCWHWLAMAEAHQQSFVVLSFNFADEVFKIIGGPPVYSDDDDDDDDTYENVNVRGEVLVLQDHLAVIHLYDKPLLLQCIEVSVWMMMEYGVEESWTMVYKIHPNYYGRLSRLVGVYSCPVKVRDKDDESGIIHIERLSFEDNDINQTILCDKHGYEAFSGCKSEYNIYWNTVGISTYMETLEPLKNLF